MSYAVSPMETLKDKHSRIPLHDIKSNVKFFVKHAKLLQGTLVHWPSFNIIIKYPVKCVTYILDNIYRKDKKHEW